MSQLILELFPARPPSFDNFVTGDNHEPVNAVKTWVTSLATSSPQHTSLYLWGATGVGKSHLLTAAETWALSLHINARRFEEYKNRNDIDHQEKTLWLIDDVHQFDDENEARLFTLYNALKLPTHVGAMIVTGNVPPAQLHMREDAKSRLQWGLIYEVIRLSDEDKTRALLARAQEKDLPLSEEILHYLMRTLPRDMRTLITVLDALDDAAREKKRAITLPFVRELLGKK